MKKGDGLGIWNLTDGEVEGVHREVALGPKENVGEVLKLWNGLGWD